MYGNWQYEKRRVPEYGNRRDTRSVTSSTKNSVGGGGGTFASILAHPLRKGEKTFAVSFFFWGAPATLLWISCLEEKFFFGVAFSSFQQPFLSQVKLGRISTIHKTAGKVETVQLGWNIERLAVATSEHKRTLSRFHTRSLWGERRGRGKNGSGAWKSVLSGIRERSPPGGKEIYAGKKTKKKKIRPAGKSRKYPSTERRMIPQKKFQTLFLRILLLSGRGVSEKKREPQQGGVMWDKAEEICKENFRFPEKRRTFKSSSSNTGG